MNYLKLKISILFTSNSLGVVEKRPKVLTSKSHDGGVDDWHGEFDLVDDDEEEEGFIVFVKVHQVHIFGQSILQGAQFFE